VQSRRPTILSRGKCQHLSVLSSFAQAAPTRTAFGGCREEAPLKHAYFAVDFFFALSGYVVAYAYVDRRTRMSNLQFF
jgi:peptidoglycan/LPS O-acetylase OafA/YrhL